ncbi:MAG TPA: A/G-specific adenine glycosylase [Crocinitomix sp.]|nr:A/G-specific adenine glycosylase [Crocinitomix sp.]
MPEFTTLIQQWYRLNKRDLPWRNVNCAYKIWISEIILQQTQVVQGLDYYDSFIKKYPTVYALANATEQDVLHLWQGLGYYSRARNLHFTAKQIVNEFNGVFPNTYNLIIKLKGVGDYTASAIASFAFNEPHAVVDGNVYRVLSRVFNINTPINSSKGIKAFKQLASTLLDNKKPGVHNQALMEVGALICKPKLPLCHQCPLNHICLGFKNSNQLNFPVKIKKVNIKKRTLNYLVVTDKKDTIVIKKRDKGDIWQGLYDFPSADHYLNTSHILLDCEIKHILTHQHITAKFWIFTSDNYTPKNNEIKVKTSRLSDYPLPQLMIKYFKQSNHFIKD